MSNFQEIDISLTKLNLDLENSRHPEEMKSQREVLEWMSNGDKNTGAKIFALAKDIVAHGLNPTERIMVKSNQDGSYTVLEGNRRVTALKLLRNPAIAPEKNRWSLKYSKLSKTPNFTPLRKVPCVVVDDEDIAFHFMEIKHLGGHNGAGTEGWGSNEKARHEHRRNRKSKLHKALALLEHVKGSDLYDEKTQLAANKDFPITTLDRLLADRDFREFMGLEINKDGELAFSVEPIEAAKIIKRVIKDFGAGGGKNVRDVINKEAREEYKLTIRNHEKPDLNKRLNESIIVSADLRGTSEPESEEDENESTPKPPRYANAKKRKTLIIPGTFLPIDLKSHNRINRIFDELKKLPLQPTKDNRTVFPNAVSTLLRSFIEMSIDAFLEKRQISCPNPTGWEKANLNLNERLKAVKDYIHSEGLMTKDQITVLNKIVNNNSKLASINTLNNYVHNRSHIPTANDLIEIWDTYFELMACIWENLK